MKIFLKIYVILITIFLTPNRLNYSSELWYIEIAKITNPHSERIRLRLGLPDLNYKTKIKYGKEIEAHIKNFKNPRNLKKTIN